MVFQLAYGLETVVLRVFNVYGPRQGFGEYGGDGMQTRDCSVCETFACWGDSCWILGRRAP